MNDTYEYVTAAKNLEEADTLYCGELQPGVDLRLYSRRPPAYPVVIYLLGNWLPQYSAVLLFQIVLMGVTGWLAWLLSGRFKVGPGPRMVMLAILLLHPTQAIYTQMLMAEAFLCFCLIAYFYGVVRFSERPQVHWLIFLNAALSLAVLAKPVMLYFWIPNLVLHLWWFRQRKGWRVVLIGLLPFLTIQAWSLRNYAVTGTYHFSSIVASQMELRAGQGMGRNESGSDFSAAEKSAAQAYLKRTFGNLPRTARVVAWHSFYLLADPGRFDLYELMEWEHDVRAGDFLKESEAESWAEKARSMPIPAIAYLTVNLLVNLCVLVGFFFFFIFLYRRWREGKPLVSWIVLIAIVGYTVAACAFGALGAARYRMPIEPLLLLSSLPLFEKLSAWQIRR